MARAHLEPASGRAYRLLALLDNKSWIADARVVRKQARKQLFEGVDPSSEKRLARLAADTEARTTFGLIAAEYIDGGQRRLGSNAHQDARASRRPRKTTLA